MTLNADPYDVQRPTRMNVMRLNRLIVAPLPGDDLRVVL